MHENKCMLCSRRGFGYGYRAGRIRRRDDGAEGAFSAAPGRDRSTHSGPPLHTCRARGRAGGCHCRCHCSRRCHCRCHCAHRDFAEAARRWRHQHRRAARHLLARRGWQGKAERSRCRQQGCLRRGGPSQAENVDGGAANRAADASQGCRAPQCHRHGFQGQDCSCRPGGRAGGAGADESGRHWHDGTLGRRAHKVH